MGRGIEVGVARCTQKYSEQGRAGRGGAGGQFGKLGVPTDRYLVESFQKCFWLGQRWKGGSYHLEGPRWWWRGR